ncbi:cysteine protease-like [Ipomoea triloba]|uniref:cysteine protease-like n=1 Tax=Ipomoea triloba TaxID=35885 RepID=UPI00125E82B6|nr:cysteine protease-like [Ipomoea triloba]
MTRAERKHTVRGFSSVNRLREQRSLRFVFPRELIECCFAVATAEALGALCVVEGLQPFHIELSVQEIFDNSQKLPENSHQIFEDLPYRNSNRGAGKYIQDFGICEALDYPYRGRKAKKPRCTDRKFWQLKTATDENEILAEIRRCPIAGLVWGDDNLTELGADEIYDPDPTQATKVRGHAVLITGYATIGGIPCYEVKNSWGIGWGAQGYGMIARRVMPKVVAFKSAYIEPAARTTNNGLARRKMIRW